jgi:ABC-type multidrug transport system ATPase subunit
MTVVLRADSIRKSYGDKAVLTSATLRAVQGTLTYLIGRNGCGKSTLLRIAAGELAADNGVVSFKGRVSERQRWHRMARDGFAYLPDRELLSPRRTVREHLDAVVSQFGFAGHATAVETCRLESLLDARCAALSTGERRRVEVATILARRPDCVLADEPYRNLDPVDRQIIAAALREITSQGCAVVVTGHEVSDLVLSVDAVSWCTDGTTYELGPPREALTNWRLVQSYLGGNRASDLLAELGDGVVSA